MQLNVKKGLALSISNLRVRVGGIEVLKGINLDIASGEVHAIMGPNGSGKSTLASALSAKPGYEIISGSIVLGDVDLTNLEPYERARAGLFIASQYPLEVPGVKVQDLLCAGLESIDEDEVLHLIDEVSTKLEIPSEILNRGINVDLSGGERKRLEILQFGVLKPRFVVLDELDSGLDVDSLNDLSEFVKNVSQVNGTTVLAITHYARVLEVLQPSKVHVLSGGTIERSGGIELASELEAVGYGA